MSFCSMKRPLKWQIPQGFALGNIGIDPVIAIATTKLCLYT
jgi:hypothetical protein